MARKMKDSGIEWIGEIPEGWSVSRIKHVAEFEPKCDTSNLSSDSIITYTPMECVKNGFFENRTASYDSLATSLTPFQEGDIVMAKVTPCFENGNIAVMSNLSSGFGLGSSELFVFRPFLIDTRYFFYWLQNNDFIHRACSTMTGTGGLKRVSPYFVRNCEIHLPPATDQHRIAAYLDTQCAKIDAVLEQTRNSIEEYKKLKQAVITQAVTKGIRPGRKMKDSGIEWIGEIPETWDMVKLKFFLSSDKVNLRVGPFGSALAGSDYKQEGVWVYNQRVILDNNFDENNTFVNEEKYEELRGFEVLPGDILITTRGSIGKIAIVPQNAEKGILHPCVIKFRVNQNLISHTLIWHIFNNTDVAMRQIKDMSNSTTIEVLYSYSLKNVQIPCIPQEEWDELEHYIVKKASRFDYLIGLKQQVVSELESYKKSLIYECVTGKREV